MKLLLDQNLSHRLVKALVETYPETSQVALLNLGEVDDSAIWAYAKAHDYVIVSKDADFYELSMLLGGPSQVIWIRCGNKPKSVVLTRLISNQAKIEEALKNPQTWCLEIY